MPGCAPISASRFCNAWVGVAAVTVAVALLFVAFGSSVVDEAVAVFVITVPATVFASSLTTMVKVELAPEPKLGLVQVSVPLAPTGGFVQDQPVAPLLETKV